MAAQLRRDRGGRFRVRDDDAEQIRTEESLDQRLEMHGGANHLRDGSYETIFCRGGLDQKYLKDYQQFR